MGTIEGARERLKDPKAENAGGVPAGFGLKIARARYDFAVEGGVAGDINLLPTADIPTDAVILGGYLDVITVPTSAGAATIAIKVEGAGDIVAAAAISGAPWSTAGRKSVIPVFTGSTTLKTTAARNVVATVGTANLTAGKFDAVLFYVEAPQ